MKALLMVLFWVIACPLLSQNIVTLKSGQRIDLGKYVRRAEERPQLPFGRWDYERLGSVHIKRVRPSSLAAGKHDSRWLLGMTMSLSLESDGGVRIDRVDVIEVNLPDIAFVAWSPDTLASDKPCRHDSNSIQLEDCELTSRLWHWPTSSDYHIGGLSNFDLPVSAEALFKIVSTERAVVDFNNFRSKERAEIIDRRHQWKEASEIIDKVFQQSEAAGPSPNTARPTDVFTSATKAAEPPKPIVDVLKPYYIPGYAPAAQNAFDNGYVGFSLLPGWTPHQSPDKHTIRVDGPSATTIYVVISEDLPRPLTSLGPIMNSVATQLLHDTYPSQTFRVESACQLKADTISKWNAVSCLNTMLDQDNYRMLLGSSGTHVGGTGYLLVFAAPADAKTKNTTFEALKLMDQMSLFRYQ